MLYLNLIKNTEVLNANWYHMEQIISKQAKSVN